MILMNGKEYREKNIPLLKEKINKLDIQLGLAVIQVGNNPASDIYVKQKEKMALELGYKFIHKRFEENVTNEDPSLNTSTEYSISSALSPLILYNV